MCVCVHAIPVADVLGARGIADEVAVEEGDEQRLLEELLVVRRDVANKPRPAASADGRWECERQ